MQEVAATEGVTFDVATPAAAHYLGRRSPPLHAGQHAQHLEQQIGSRQSRIAARIIGW